MAAPRSAPKLRNAYRPKRDPEDAARAHIDADTKRFALPHIAEAILNHISGHKSGIAGVYNKAVYLRERREALDKWGGHISTLLGAI